MNNIKQLTAAVVGLRMGGGHASVYAKLPEYKLAAVCDINEELAKESSEKFGAGAYYTDYAEMLEKVKPDVVCVATPNTLHCEMTLQAIENGAKGVYCEKPVAMNIREAKAMRNAAEKKGAAMAVGHQRRMSAPYITMKKAIQDGLIGDVYLMRGLCAGDFLSDGTHTIDSLMYFNDDCDVNWVLGQIYRGPIASEEMIKANKYAYIGKRFGHNTERGAISSFQLANGVRCETLSGDQMLMPGRWYQDIEVFGSKGRLWRNNDQSDPPVKINNLDTKGEWKELPLVEENIDSGLFHAHKLFAETVLNGAEHPMSMAKAMKGFEVVMAIYESARLNARIEFPLLQEEFPLDLMIKERGEF
jgi:predicted dehydrogenase